MRVCGRGGSGEVLGVENSLLQSLHGVWLPEPPRPGDRGRPEPELSALPGPVAVRERTPSGHLTCVWECTRGHWARRSIFAPRPHSEIANPGPKSHHDRKSLKKHENIKNFKIANLTVFLSTVSPKICRVRLRAAQLSFSTSQKNFSAGNLNVENTYWR